jgi:hypothetical protein
MNRILLCLAAMPLTFVMRVGCAGDRDVSGQPEPARSQKVEAEFISMEATPEDLERLGIEWPGTNASPTAHKQGK